MTAHTATAAEALAEGIEFNHNGVTYSVEPTSEWPLEALEALEEGRIVAFLKYVLGDEGYAALKATKPKIGELNDLTVAIQKAVGVAGN